MENIVLGIDLGTTNSCMAIIEQGYASIIPNAEGGRTTPSIVHFGEEGEILVGQAAKAYCTTQPHCTIRSVKSILGRYYNEVSSKLDKFSYPIVPGEKGRAAIQISQKGVITNYLPEQISALILKKLKADAEAYLSCTIKDAVITVPAYFNDAQRQSVRDAGRIANLNVIRIINEPTAAAVAYGLHKGKQETLLVFDLGGGTHDVSILKTGDSIFDVLSTSGDTELGGDDWDRAILEHLLNTITTNTHVSIVDPSSIQRVREAAELAKIQLSSAPRYQINLPFLTGTTGEPIHFMYTLTRETLERIVSPLVEKTLQPLVQAVQDANLTYTQIDRIIPVGGMTRSPLVLDLLKKTVGKEVTRGVNPDEVVAIGAAFQGAAMVGQVKNLELRDITPLSLGVETWGNIVKILIPRNTKVPIECKDYFTNGIDNQPSFDIHIVQGERKFAKDNKSLGLFHINELPEAPRGCLRLEITFKVNNDGILEVSAEEQSTGTRKELVIADSYALTDIEVQNMRQIAEQNDADDQIRVQQVHYYQIIQDIISECNTLLSKWNDIWSIDETLHITNALDLAKKELTNTNIDSYKENLKNITSLLQPISSKVRKLKKENKVSV